MITIGWGLWRPNKISVSMFVQVSNAVRSSPSLPQLVSHRSPWWGYTLWDQRSHSDGWIFPLFSIGNNHRLIQRVHFPASYVSLPECTSENIALCSVRMNHSLPKLYQKKTPGDVSLTEKFTIFSRWIWVHHISRKPKLDLPRKSGVYLVDHPILVSS